MKTLLSCFFTASAAVLFAATGERSDDYLVLLVPAVFLSLVAAIYFGKEKYKAWKQHREELVTHADTPA